MTPPSQLVKGLRFYADGPHYEEEEHWNSFKQGEKPPPQLFDRGEIASAVLAALSAGIGQGE